MRGIEKRIEELEEKAGLRSAITPITIKVVFGRSARRLQTSFEKKVDTEERDCE